MVSDDNDDVERRIEFGTIAEQKDEAFYDDRSDADDDMEKGRIKFPDDKLYGRDKELKHFEDIFESFHVDGASRVVFLAGYSGTGKSALVEEFVRKNVSEKGSVKATAAYIFGKFSQIKAGDPFSAITQALDQYIIRLTRDVTDDEAFQLKKRLAKVDISLGSYDAGVLKGTLIPALDGLLGRRMKDDGSPSSGAKPTAATGADFNVIKYVFQNFIKALASEETPIAMFIDDLQWADDASLQLLASLLKDKSLSYVMFVGAYRVNEVNEEHEFTKMMKDVEETKRTWAFKGSKLTTRMEITNLSPDSVSEFLADSIDRSTEEVSLISEAVYSKTLGNIFFVKQALEELARKNAIYYDVICFQWQFGDVSRVELEHFLSDDVVQMVQAKLETLPKALQKALAVAAYTENTIDLRLLAAMLKAECIDTDTPGLQKMMKRAFIEGLVLGKDDSGMLYKFAHDRIREAACASVPAGDERHKFLLRISTVLERRGAPGKDNWMLFAAARHLNSIPSSMTSPLRMAELNFRVGKISVAKGAFNEAVIFLRAGHDRLDQRTCWKDNYKLTLDLKTNLAETEHFLGNEDLAIELTNDIFNNAKTLVEKSRAHFVHIEAMSKNSANYDNSIAKAIEILEMYGMKIPVDPTENQLKLEKFRLKLALRGRNLLCLSKLAVATDDFVVSRSKVAVMTLIYANYGKKPSLATMVGHRVLREGLQLKSITKDFPFILVMLGSPLRQQEKYDGAFAYANAGISLMDRFPNEKGLEFVKAKMALYGVLSCLRLPFREAIDTYLELYKLLLAKGEIEMALGAGMLGMVSFINASLPLNALFEPKLLLLEEVATNLGRKTFVVIFGLIRQCLYNLQGGPRSSSNPVKLDGVAFSEEECMSSFEGAAQKMNNRDISTMRLMLAVIFNDEAVMEEMLERLEGYPVYDMSVVRQHLRMAYSGFASLILCQKNGKYKKWAKTSHDFFKKLAKFGSLNAIPLYSCMKALDKPSVHSFNEAIQACGNAGLFNVTAIMNERAALWLLDQKIKGDTYEEYLKCALWCYNDWGAMAKVAQLITRFEFLRNAMQKKAPSQLSEVRRHAAMLGVPHAVQKS